MTRVLLCMQYVLWSGKRLTNGNSISHCQGPRRVALVHSPALILSRGSGDREMGLTGKTQCPSHESKVSVPF